MGVEERAALFSHIARMKGEVEQWESVRREVSGSVQ